MSFPRNSGPDPIFDTFADLGFDTGSSPEQRCEFLFARSSSRPNDWQPSRNRVADSIPGSNRTLRQDMGSGPLTLTTDALFRDKYAFQKFMRNRHLTGTLRMNADYTVWPPTREVPLQGVVYAEFDAVVVADDPSAVTFDLQGVVHCRIVFEREES